jgi:carbonic anhydrase
LKRIRNLPPSGNASKICYRHKTIYKTEEIMRTVYICVLVAIASMVAILTLDSDEKPAHQAVSPQAATRHQPEVTAAESTGFEYASTTAEQRDHTKQLAHDMAAQHGEHAQAVEQAYSSAPAGSHKVHWAYQGEEGPSNWGKLSAEYAMCGSGLNQSPINLASFVEADLPALTFNYAGMAVELINNGHTVQVNYHPGSNLVVDGRIFQLKQFHFHAPSENLLNGKSYPLEAHFVHADSQGSLAVVAVLFESGDANLALAKLWERLPQAGQSETLAAQVKATDLLPDVREYYRFNGSLTTPPCSQGVIWLVMKQTLPVSSAQVATFSRLMGGPNNRPVQPLNARTVLQ